MRRAALVLAVALAVAGSVARAQDEPEQPAEAEQAQGQQQVDGSAILENRTGSRGDPRMPGTPSAAIREEGEPPSIPRRAIPSYDGREDPGPTAEEVLLWFPRVLFFPVHVVLEYLLRQPIGWLLTTAERENWTVVLVDFFTWDERKAGLVPTAFYDFGFQPSAGLYFWWNDFLAPGNQLRTQVGFGGVDWLRATLSDRVQASEQSELAFTVDAWRRPDYVFHGIGWDSQHDRRSRYVHSYVEGDVHLRFRPWRASELAFSTGVRWNDFEPGGYAFSSGDPSLGEAVMQGFYELPPGFEGYTAYRHRADLVLDTREDRPAPGHGLRLEGFVEQGFDLEQSFDARWIRYGGALGGFVDVGSNRVFALWAVARFADPFGTTPAPVEIPFTEHIALGGEPLLMGGFLRGQLIGRSAFVATLEYRYPIWVFLDGSMHFSVGNVFDERLSDFDPERLRMSFGLGVRSIGDRDQSFNVLVAFGSAPFVDGADIESIRLVIGSQQGF